MKQNEPDKKPDTDKKKNHRTGTVDSINEIINSPTEAARRHHHTDQWSNQGANISYEGATAPAGGGSVGTGYSSGEDAVGARITTEDESDAVVHQHTSAVNQQENKDEHLTRPESSEPNKEDTIGNS